MAHLLLSLLTMLANFVAVVFGDGLQVLLLASDCCNHYHPLNQENVMEVVLSCLDVNIRHMHLMNIRNEVRWLGFGHHHALQRQIENQERIKSVGRLQENDLLLQPSPSMNLYNQV